MNKKTLLNGIIASSVGIFISKFLGLLYVIPLNSLAQEVNMSFYSITYTFYGLILNICTAGIPFAIASLVAKYIASDDYATVNLVKKVGISFVLGLSFIIAIFFLLISSRLAINSLGNKANFEDIIYLKNSFYFLIIAIIFVPFLSSIRGYYQGLKEMTVYASNQVVEQVARVFLIVFLGYIFVKILNFPSIYAVYMAIFSAGIAALISLIYLKFQTRKIDDNFSFMLNKNVASNKTKKEIFKELINIGLPFIVASFLSMAAPLINTNFFISYSTKVGLDYNLSKLVLGIYQVNASKITSIPTVLTLGYSAGLVPYLTEVYEKKDYNQLKKHINIILNSINFLIIPLSFIMIILARPIYFLFFGNNNLDLGANILTHTSNLIYVDTIAPIMTSIMITLKLKKETIILLSFSVLIKYLSFFLLIDKLGYLGLIYSSFFSILFVLISSIVIIKIKFNINYKDIFINFIKIIFNSFVLVGGFAIFNYLGLVFDNQNRIQTMFLLMVYGILAIFLYIIASIHNNTLQTIFGKKIKIFNFKNK